MARLIRHAPNRLFAIHRNSLNGTLISQGFGDTWVNVNSSDKEFIDESAEQKLLAFIATHDGSKVVPGAKSCEEALESETAKSL